VISIHFEGRAKSHASQLRSLWKLKPGDTYNESYSSDFVFDKILDQPWARKDATSSLESSSCLEINESDRSVSLTITVEGNRKSRQVSRRDLKCADVSDLFFFAGNYVEGATNKM
jgi:hypothetical protein